MRPLFFLFYHHHHLRYISRFQHPVSDSKEIYLSYTFKPPQQRSNTEHSIITQSLHHNVFHNIFQHFPRLIRLYRPHNNFHIGRWADGKSRTRRLQPRTRRRWTRGWTWRLQLSLSCFVNWPSFPIIELVSTWCTKVSSHMASLPVSSYFFH